MRGESVNSRDIQNVLKVHINVFQYVVTSVVPILILMKSWLTANFRNYYNN